MGRPDVDSAPYERSHGKRPAGRGHWGFCPSACWSRTNYLDYVVFFDGTFREARAAAVAHFARVASTIVVCP